MKRKKIFFIFTLTLSSLYADIAGGEISIGLFKHSPAGEASYRLPFISTASSTDIKDSLGFSDTQDIFFKAYLEHPIPFVPNIKLAYTGLSHNGSQVVKAFSWGNIINFSGTIQNTLALDFSDVTLYYEILDNWIEIDTGLTLRYLSGNITVLSSTRTDAANFSTFIPMIYGKTRFNFPTTNISLQLEANAIGYSAITSYDYEVSIRYSFSMGLGVETGYKTFHLDSSELLEGFHTNMTFNGPYLLAVWDF